MTGLKILHVVPALTKGGAEKVVIELANMAASQGDEVTVLAAFRADSSLLADTLHPDVIYRCMDMPSDPKLARYIKLMPWMWAHREWIFAHDVVHCHLTFGAAFGTLLQWQRRFMRRKHPRVVETIHAVGMPIPRLQRTRIRSFAAGRDGCALMAEDSYWQSFAKKHPRMPVHVIPNGISIPPNAPSEAAITTYARTVGLNPRPKTVVGTIGRMVADRMPLKILAAFRHIADRMVGTVALLMGGEGPERTVIEAMAREIGLADKVHLPGLVRDPHMTLQIIDLYISVNVGPITGIAGLEAAAAGVPVIALQSLPSYDGTGDWIWSHCDPEKIAEHAVGVLANPTALRALAQRQSLYVREYHSAETMIRGYRDFYRAAGVAFPDDNRSVE